MRFRDCLHKLDLRQLRNAAWKILHDWDDADDAVQRALIGLADREFLSNPMAYATIAVKHRSLEALRHRNCRLCRGEVQIDSVKTVFDIPAPSPQYSEDFRRVLDVIESLSVEDQMLLTSPVPDVMRRLCISEPAAKSRIHRAKRRVRERFIELYGDPRD